MQATRGSGRMTRALGIDPGLSGGAAIVEHSPTMIRRLCCVFDLPTTGEKAKRRIDAALFYRWLVAQKPDAAFIERAQAMPDQGASSGFAYGRAVGALEACVACAGIPLYLIEASVWKRAANLPGGPAGKEASRQRVIQMFPTAEGFARKMDHQRAEAALIAIHGIERVLLRGGGIGIGDLLKAG